MNRKLLENEKRYLLKSQQFSELECDYLSRRCFEVFSPDNHSRTIDPGDFLANTLTSWELQNANQKLQSITSARFRTLCFHASSQTRARVGNALRGPLSYRRKCGSFAASNCYHKAECNQVNFNSPKDEKMYCKLFDMIIWIVEAKKQADDISMTVTIMNRVMMCLIRFDGLACP